MAKQVECPCGQVVRGDDEDEFVANVEAHVRDKHPEMASELSRERILAMASDA